MPSRNARRCSIAAGKLGRLCILQDEGMQAKRFYAAADCFYPKLLSSGISKNKHELDEVICTIKIIQKRHYFSRIKKIIFCVRSLKIDKYK